MPPGMIIVSDLHNRAALFDAFFLLFSSLLMLKLNYIWVYFESASQP